MAKKLTDRQVIEKGLDRAILKSKMPQRRFGPDSFLIVFSLIALVSFGVMLIDSKVSSPMVSQETPKETWTLAAYQELALQTKQNPKTGATMKEVVSRFGQPSERQMGDDSTRYTYKDENGDWDVIIGFGDEDGDGVYTAYSKDFHSLPFTTYPVATDENFEFRWTPERFDALPDDLSVSVDTIIDTYGPPTSVDLVGMRDSSYEGHYNLYLTYQEDNRTDSTVNQVTLIFFRMGEQAPFMLTQKRATWRTD